MEKVAVAEGMIRKENEEDWKNLLKKIGMVGWTIIIFILSGIANAIIAALLK